METNDLSKFLNDIENNVTKQVISKKEELIKTTLKERLNLLGYSFLNNNELLDFCSKRVTKLTTLESERYVLDCNSNNEKTLFNFIFKTEVTLGPDFKCETKFYIE